MNNERVLTDGVCRSWDFRSEMPVLLHLHKLGGAQVRQTFDNLKARNLKGKEQSVPPSKHPGSRLTP